MRPQYITVLKITVITVLNLCSNRAVIYCSNNFFHKKVVFFYIIPVSYFCDNIPNDSNGRLLLCLVT